MPGEGRRGWTGLFEPPEPSVWWAFACAGHAGDLTAPRGLLDLDRAEIMRRRQLVSSAQIDALAVGPAARELHARAERWAAAHPERVSRPPPVTTPHRRLPEPGGRPFDGDARDHREDGDLPDGSEQPHP